MKMKMFKINIYCGTLIHISIVIFVQMYIYMIFIKSFNIIFDEIKCHIK